MITFKHSGNFKNTERLFDGAKKLNVQRILNEYARRGVEALSSATPKDTGETASAWSYEIKVDKGNSKITWLNSSVNNGVPIVILIQYGHGTKQGAYIEGRDFINPAMKPIFDGIAAAIWMEVSKL